MMRSKLFFLFLLSVSWGVHAQVDTVKIFPRESGFQRTINKVTSSRAYQMTYIGVPLVVGGLIVKSEDDHFRQLRNAYLPAFSRRYDDYTQYLPAAVMLGMKAGGVESRSSWGRMLVSDAFSAVIMSTVVGQLKVHTKVMRPDGSNDHSFPSGHTATAFMTATMMSKEYGFKSPWYSIGAYSVATATGLTRMANNKHWLSDILAGAGFGILSTELGYFFADLIFKEKGLNRSASSETFDRFHVPSFLGLHLGLSVIPGEYRLNDHSRMSFSSGSSAGVEGAWFINPYVGFGGKFTVANMSVILNEVAEDESLDWIAGYAGAYFSYPLASRLLVGSKLLAGYGHYSACDLSTVTIGNRGGMSMEMGGSMTFLAKQNLGVKFFLDYNLTPVAAPSDKKCTQILTMGSSISVTF